MLALCVHTTVWLLELAQQYTHLLLKINLLQIICRKCIGGYVHYLGPLNEAGQQFNS